VKNEAKYGIRDAPGGEPAQFLHKNKRNIHFERSAA
jgi:hypothetical protein